MTLSEAKCPLLNCRYKSIQKELKSQKVFTVIYLCCQKQNPAGLRYSHSERNNDCDNLNILNTNWFDELYSLNHRNPIYYHLQPSQRKELKLKREIMRKSKKIRIYY